MELHFKRVNLFEQVYFEWSKFGRGMIGALYIKRCMQDKIRGVYYEVGTVYFVGVNLETQPFF